MRVYRRSARRMPYKLRAFSLYGKMRKKLNRLLRLAKLFAEASRLLHANEDDRAEGAKRMAKVLLLHCIENYFIVDVPNELVVPRHARTIDSFDEFSCYRRFRFRKDHLRTILYLLEFPAEVILPNRSKLTGEEVFLFGLNRFCFFRTRKKWTKKISKNLNENQLFACCANTLIKLGNFLAI